MFLGAYFSYRLDREGANSREEREVITGYYRITVASIAAFTLAVLALTLLGWRFLTIHPLLYAALFVGLGAAYLVAMATLTCCVRRRLRNILRPEVPNELPRVASLFEYRSKLELFGWPIIHIRLRGGLDRGPVKAWFAAGDAAIGIIFAFGAVAVAPISFGGLSLGFITLGGMAIGLVPLGGFSLGLYALGGMAVGWQAFGGCAIGWSAAEGGVAIAQGFAIGAVAFAREVNDAAARDFMENSAFFKFALAAMQYMHWLNLMWLFPLALWLQRRRTLRTAL
jgi:hypothetical protein